MLRGFLLMLCRAIMRVAKKFDCFVLPMSQRSYEAKYWNSVDLTGFASVADHVHLCKILQTRGKAG